MPLRAGRVLALTGAGVRLGLVNARRRTTARLRKAERGRVVGAERGGRWPGSLATGTGSDLSRRVRPAPATREVGCWCRTRSRTLSSRQAADSVAALLSSTLHCRLSIWGCVSKCRRRLGLSMPSPSSTASGMVRMYVGRTGKTERVHTLAAKLWSGCVADEGAREDLYEPGEQGR